MTKPLKVDRKLAKDSPYFASKCGEWLTNGHWLWRREQCDLKKSAEESVSRSPDVASLFSGLPLGDYRHAIKSTELVYSQACLWLTGEKAPKVWLGVDYTTALEATGAHAWLADDSSAILFTATEVRPITATDIMGAIMPVRIEIPDFIIKAL